MRNLQKPLQYLLFIFLLPLALQACSSGRGSAPEAIQAYHEALVDKDAERLASLSCADWEDDARLELESFGAVQTTLESLDCQESSADGDEAVVACTGKIKADYNGEILEINLADRSYQAVKEAGEWRMCGYR